MNTKAATILVLFLGWSFLSWKWYVCRIKQKCEDEPQTALILPADTVVNEVNIKTDSSMIPEKKVVEEFDHKTLLYFQSKYNHFDEDTNISAYLNKLALKLATTKDTLITVAGLIDTIYKGENRLTLSYQLAKDVQTYMVAKGAPLAKIKIEGKEEKEHLVVDTAHRAKNKRVEILFN